MDFIAYSYSHALTQTPKTEAQININWACTLWHILCLIYGLELGVEVGCDAKNSEI